MASKTRENSSVVKIDPVLLERIDSFISREENRIRFMNKKQFVNIAVLDYLERIKKEDKK